MLLLIIFFIFPYSMHSQDRITLNLEINSSEDFINIVKTSQYTHIQVEEQLENKDILEKNYFFDSEQRLIKKEILKNKTLIEYKEYSYQRNTLTKLLEVYNLNKKAYKKVNFYNNFEDLESYYIEDAQGNLIESLKNYFNGSKKIYSIYENNERDIFQKIDYTYVGFNIFKIFSNKNNVKELEELFYYDDRGQLLQETYKNYVDHITHTIYYAFNKKNELQEKKLEVNGVLSESETLTYNDQGLIILEEYKENHDNALETVKYTLFKYNNLGQKTGEEIYDSYALNPYNSKSYNYNKQGLIGQISTTSFHLEEDRIIDISYTKEGWVKTRLEKNGVNKQISFEEYEYNEKGHIKKEFIQKLNNPPFIRFYNYTYDALNNVILKENLNSKKEKIAYKKITIKTMEQF